MITATRDPITMNDVRDLANAPFIVEGSGEHATKIYFESEANRQAYRETEMHGSLNTGNLKRIFDAAADSPITGSIN